MTRGNVLMPRMDVDQPAPPAAMKPKAPAAQRKTASQKAMELKERERDVRVLIRNMQRWADIRQRYDIIVSVEFKFAVVLSSILTMTQVTESKLQDKNQGMLRTILLRFALWP